MSDNTGMWVAALVLAGIGVITYTTRQAPVKAAEKLAQPTVATPPSSATTQAVSPQVPVLATSPKIDEHGCTINEAVRCPKIGTSARTNQVIGACIALDATCPL